LDSISSGPSVTVVAPPTTTSCVGSSREVSSPVVGASNDNFSSRWVDLTDVFVGVSYDDKSKAPSDQDEDSIDHDLCDYIDSGMSETNLDSGKNYNEVFQARH
jgi:hypothetical protein